MLVSGTFRWSLHSRVQSFLLAARYNAAVAIIEGLYSNTMVVGKLSLTKFQANCAMSCFLSRKWWTNNQKEDQRKKEKKKEKRKKKERKKKKKKKKEKRKDKEKNKQRTFTQLLKAFANFKDWVIRVLNDKVEAERAQESHLEPQNSLVKGLVFLNRANVWWTKPERRDKIIF